MDNRHYVGRGEPPPLADKSVWSVIESGFGTVLEFLVSALVVAEVVILFAGIVGRVLGHPITWSDELASLLFLWLAMLGAVVAVRRSEHMRMTALVNVAGPETRSFLEALALAGALAFLLAIAHPTYEYALEARFITTPALNMEGIWRAAAVPVGVALMALIIIVKLTHATESKYVLAALMLMTGLAGLGYLAAPILRDWGNYNLIIFFVGALSATVLAGIPIAFSFGLATVGYLAFTTSIPLEVLVGRLEEGVSSIILLAVPLFVFLGLLVEMTGLAKAMVAFLASLLGHVKGGLSYVLIGAMYLVSGISGSKAADMAAVVPVLFPEMRKRGAEPGELVALLSATGAQTETLPPSLVLIAIGSTTGVSIAALFAGGLLPGLVLALALCVVVGLRSRNEKVGLIKRATKGEIGRAFVIALPALALPVVIRTAVVEGIATATEVSTIGILYTVIVGLLFYRQFNWHRLKPMLTETASLSGAILLIIGTATSMGYALTQSGFSMDLAQAMASLPGGRPMFIAISILAFIVLGSVLEGIPAIVLFAPLLFPIAKQLGVHEVHYAMVVVLSMGIGLFAPPFGVGYYTACAIGKVSPDQGMRPIRLYMLTVFIGVVIVACVPWISTGFL
jgi:tripartite ATP-independent transporter DctM subunit